MVVVITHDFMPLEVHLQVGGFKKLCLTNVANIVVVLLRMLLALVGFQLIEAPINERTHFTQVALMLLLASLVGFV